MSLVQLRVRVVPCACAMLDGSARSDVGVWAIYETLRAKLSFFDTKPRALEIVGQTSGGLKCERNQKYEFWGLEGRHWLFHDVFEALES